MTALSRTPVLPADPCGPAIRPLATFLGHLGMTALGHSSSASQCDFVTVTTAPTVRRFSLLFKPSGRKVRKISSVEDVARPTGFERVASAFGAATIPTVQIVATKQAKEPRWAHTLPASVNAALSCSVLNRGTLTVQ